MSTFAQRFQLGPFFNAGVLAGAAKLEHYEAGTSTLKNIWSDRGMTTPLAQPFVADADGIFNFFADGLYKLVVKASDDTLLYTLDNWQIIDRTDPTFAEGTVIASASTIAVGPEIFAHISGGTNISTVTGSIPFFWAVFDGTLTLVHSASLLCPGSVNMTVKTGDVLFLLNEGAGVWRVGGQLASSLLVGAETVQVSVTDTRTNTVDTPFTVTSQTTGTPAAGIGTAILVQGESADEAPSDFGRVEFVASDIAAGSEDTYFQVLLRVAGAALSAAYRFVTTTAFNAIFTHANSADRTYTLPNASYILDAGDIYKGPTSTGSGSTAAHEGTVTISSSQALSGVHFYTDFTLNASQTLTIDDNAGRLCIVATGTITINGTIDGIGAGSAGGRANVANSNAPHGVDGSAQPGGGGGSGGSTTIYAGDGGHVLAGLPGRGGINAAGAQGTHLTGELVTMTHPFNKFGGSGGGTGSGTGVGGGGGNGGASIILCAPAVILGASSVLSTSGETGAGASSGVSGGGGGGGAGDVLIYCRTYTDNGATFTMTGGAAGSGVGGGNAGAAGRDGVKQIVIYV